MTDNRLKNQEIPYNIKEPITLERISQDVMARIFDTIPVSSMPLDIRVMTGEYGLTSIHNEMETKYNFSYSLKVSSDIVMNQASYVYQTAFCKFEMLHNPQLDNIRLHGINIPDSHFPLSSGLFHIFFAGYPVITYQPFNLYTDNEEEE